jgi:hypothetical protein
MTTVDEVEQETASLKHPRDAGSYIGNEPWKGVRGDPITGTHNGHLDADARERRRIKNARHRQNRMARTSANQSRGNRV